MLRERHQYLGNVAREKTSTPSLPIQLFTKTLDVGMVTTPLHQTRSRQPTRTNWQKCAYRQRISSTALSFPVPDEDLSVVIRLLSSRDARRGSDA